MDDADLERLERIETERKLQGLDRGEPGAAIYAIWLCSFHDDMQPPAWALKEFRRQYAMGLHGKLRSWDDVFGRPPRTKVQMERYARHLALMPKVWAEVASAKDGGRPINNELFKEIGAKLRVGSSTLTSRLYSAWCRVRGRP
jgi:hypothetical protein